MQPILNGSWPSFRTSGGAPLASITASDVERFLHAEKNRGLANGTANAGVRVLRIVLNTAGRKGSDYRQRCRGGGLARGGPDKRLPFALEQVRALLEVADTEWRGLILLGFYAGMRLGDAARLTWANVDLENRVVVSSRRRRRRAAQARRRTSGRSSTCTGTQ